MACPVYDIWSLSAMDPCGIFEQLSAYQGFCSTQFVVVCCTFPIKPNCCSYEHHYWIWSVLRKPHYARFILLLIKNYVRNTQNLSPLYKTLWCIDYIAFSEKNNIQFCNSYIHTRKSHTDLPTNPSDILETHFTEHISYEPEKFWRDRYIYTKILKIIRTKWDCFYNEV